MKKGRKNTKYSKKLYLYFFFLILSVFVILFYYIYNKNINNYPFQDLNSTQWELIQVNEQKVDDLIVLSFKDNIASISACNLINFGDFIVTNTNISFNDNPTSTKMACDEDLMLLESSLVENLKDTFSYKLQDGELYINTNDTNFIFSSFRSSFNFVRPENLSFEDISNNVSGIADTYVLGKIASSDFNEKCYLDRYPDVKKGWVDLGLKAIDHWNQYGRYENRIPGCSSTKKDPSAVKPITPTDSSKPNDSQEFNERCYLSRYPDIVNKWARKGIKTVNHWKRYGIKEKRIPGCDVDNLEPEKIVGSGDNPVTIEVDVLRYAGAVKSLKWNQKEFINIYDHGRQLQSAMQVDGFFECNNPTEAGSYNDHKKPYSTSEIIRLRKPSSNTLTTNSKMAYWVWDSITGACAKGQDKRVNSPLSGHRLEKKITIGVLSDPQIIDYKVTYVHPEGSYKEKIVYEFLTGYLNSEFDKFWYVSLKDKKAVSITAKELRDISGKGFPKGSFHARPELKSKYDPVIMSNKEETHAMGVYVPKSLIESCKSKFHSYNMYHFKLGGSGPNGNTTNKWSLAVEDLADSPCIINNTRSFQVYLTVGTLKEVESKLLKLAENFK